ncbi:MAG: hypothetical protein WCC53_05180 [Thermoanaerobaculia bacterium]
MSAPQVAQTPPVRLAENRRESGSRTSSLVPRILTLLVLAASALGLLSVPVNVYDDSLFLLGARLVASGKTPYIDFYTHYGPLGYTILAFLLRLVGNPGLALRVGEVLLLTGMTLLLHLLFRSLHLESPRREYPVPFLVLALSFLALYAAFIGFAFATGSVVLFLLARSERGLSATLLYGAAGAALAVGVLTRPVFGAYCAGAVFLLEIVCRSRSEESRSLLVTPAVFFGAAAGAVLVLWLSLFRGIPWTLAFDATILRPARLMGAGGERYLKPDFLTAAQIGVLGIVRAIATEAALVATTIAWTLAVSQGRTRRLAAGCVAVGGLLPLVLTVSEDHARDAGFLSLAFFALACTVVYSARSALRESPLLRASATFGLVAAAFGHYFWARADRQHLLPMLTLSLLGAALLLEPLRPARRAAVIGLALFTWASAVPSLSFPAAVFFNRGLAASLWPWQCTLVRADAKMAVAYADSLAAPKSRFVAVGSTQALTSANPILLFLISSRLPYTKWFQYDPGVQTSPAVQKEMERELLASGSRSAVVWRTEKYLVDSVSPSHGPRSQFDDFFDRLYPITAAKFGDYEVRVRALAPTD